MELKHKECFCPAFIKHFNLQAVSGYARETWEFVNLYSKTRGINRFSALIQTLELLGKRDEVAMRGVTIPAVDNLKKWVESEADHGNFTLKEASSSSSDLAVLYDWSMDVNKTIAEIVKNVPPFPYVKESLKKIQGHADSIVISQTPVEALNREWDEHGIAGFVKMIAGQEMGTKTEHIFYAAKGKYDDDKILMIGDALEDLKAAKNNGALFLPIIPGQEEKSWELFYKDGLDRFLDGTFAGQYEEKLTEEFFINLPSLPLWHN